MFYTKMAYETRLIQVGNQLHEVARVEFSYPWYVVLVTDHTVYV